MLVLYESYHMFYISAPKTPLAFVEQKKSLERAKVTHNN